MRLTLRTLLAYMDDILDPADHDELQQKIESSDFATELIHRSRDAVRRLRLGAPEIDAGDNDEVLGGDPSLDANAVAEYLDNTMAPEQVAEFERCCLEVGNFSDMRLAEVASCHHILTMVLGEPADVRPEVRGRMYQVGSSAAAVETGSGEKLRIEPAHATGSAASPVAAPPVAAVVADDDEDVPDYLRAAARDERRKRTWQFASVAAILIVGVGIGYFARPVAEPDLSAVDPGVANNLDDLVEGPELGAGAAAPLAGEGDADASNSASVADGSDEAPAWDASAAEEEAPAWTPAPPAEGPAATTPGSTEPSDPSDDADPPGDAAPPANYRAEAGDTTLPTDDQGNLVFEDPPLEGASPLLLEQPQSPAETPANVARPEASPLDDPDWDAALSAEASQPPAPEPTSDQTSEPGSDQQDDPEGESTAADRAPAAPSPPGADAEASSQVLGEYQGNDDLLLIYAANAERWVRLPGRTKLTAGDRLLTLPMFRAHVDLAGVHVTLIDGALVQLAPPAADGHEADARLELVYGRLLIRADLDGSRVALVTGEHVHDLVIGPSADLAVDVQRRFLPGEVAENAGPLEVTWHLTSGSLGEGDEAVEAPATWQTIDGVETAPEPFEQLPAWIDQRPLSPYEREARRTVASALEAGRPVSIPLLELSDKQGLGRRREVRSLAARSGAYVGVFQPFVTALNDPDLNQLVWERQIETVRHALARDPAASQRLREDFAAQRGETAADDLMEMITGYDREAVGQTAEERKAGALPRLIRWLDSDQLDYRVLALYNLNQITGTRNQGNYRPTHTPQQRQRPLRIYWDRLEKDELQPRGE